MGRALVGDMFSRVTLPADTTLATRLDWSAERLADLAEGLLTAAEGEYVLTAVIGWTDLCSDADRAQYRVAASQLKSLINDLA